MYVRYRTDVTYLLTVSGFPRCLIMKRQQVLVHKESFLAVGIALCLTLERFSEAF